MEPLQRQLLNPEVRGHSPEQVMATLGSDKRELTRLQHARQSKQQKRRPGSKRTW